LRSRSILRREIYDRCPRARRPFAVPESRNRARSIEALGADFRPFYVRSSRDFYQPLVGITNVASWMTRFYDSPSSVPGRLEFLATLEARRRSVFSQRLHNCRRNVTRECLPVLVGKSAARTRWHGLANDPREATSLSDLCRGVNL